MNSGSCSHGAVMPTIKNETTAIDKTFKYKQYHVTVLLKNCNLGKQLQKKYIILLNVTR